MNIYKILTDRLHERDPAAQAVAAAEELLASVDTMAVYI